MPRKRQRVKEGRGAPRRSECKRGHPFTRENTIYLLDKSRLPTIAYQRKCRACHLERQRRFRERHGLTTTRVA